MKAAGVSGVARLGIGFMITWSVSSSSRYSAEPRSSGRSRGSVGSRSSSCRTELGRLSTPKPKWRDSTACESSTVKSEGISSCSPSGSPFGVAHSRVNPTASAHGPARCEFFFQSVAVVGPDRVSGRSGAGLTIQGSSRRAGYGGT